MGPKHTGGGTPTEGQLEDSLLLSLPEAKAFSYDQIEYHELQSHEINPRHVDF